MSSPDDTVPDSGTATIRSYLPTIKLNSTGWVVVKGRLFLARHPPWDDPEGDWTSVYDKAIRTGSLEEAMRWVRLLRAPRDKE